MKSEERHELAQNDLEIRLERLWLWFQKNWHLPLLVFALLLLAYQGYNWWQTNRDIKLQESWNELSLAMEGDNTAAKLKGVIAKYDNPAVRAFGYVQLGDLYSQYVLLGTPADGYRGVKATRQEALNEARDAYQRVISEYSTEPLAATLARLGLGHVYEAMNQWDKAAEQYKVLVADKNAPAYGAEAQRRLDHLNEWKAAGEKYAFLAAATTSAPATTTAPAVEKK